MPDSTFQRPSWSRHGTFIRLAYELHHRVYDSRLYPVKSSNGSSILLYGHDGGLTVLWRGGRPASRLSTRVSNAPSHEDGAVDMDVDGQGPPQHHNAHDTEDYENKLDPSLPCDPITAIQEIQLQTSVFALAAAPLPPGGTARQSLPSVFINRIIVALACSDRTVRLLSLPIDPGSAHSKITPTAKKGKDGVRCITVTEPHVHSSIPRGVAFSYAAVPTRREGWESDDEEDGNDAQSPRPGNMWQLLVASHAAETNSTLAITRLHFPDGYSGTSLDGAELSTDAIFPEGMGVAISFNPARYPSKRHSQLLFAESTGAVRLYDTLTLKRKYLGRPTFVNPDVPPVFRTKLLATFFAPFQRPSDPILQAFGLRHRILDAQWVLNGKCIIVVIDDGRWGIWDFLQVGPQFSQSNDRTQDLSGIQSIPSTGITAFAIQGIVGSGSEENSKVLSNPIPSKEGRSTRGPSSLAPMTPKTRKTKQQHLFSPPSGGLSSRRLVKGKVSVSTNTHTGGSDETVVIWYDGEFFVIPHLFSYWKRMSEAHKSSDTDRKPSTITSPSLPIFTALSTLGEMVTNICQDSEGRSSSPNQVLHDILLSAEHRLVMLCPEKSQRKSTEHLEGLFEQMQQPSEEEGAIQLADQDHLERRELDIGGIDRMLGNMSSGRRPLKTSTGSPKGRRQHQRGPFLALEQRQSQVVHHFA